MTVDVESGSRQAAIAAALREQIESGDLAPGSAVASESELSQQFSLSRAPSAKLELTRRPTPPQDAEALGRPLRAGALLGRDLRNRDLHDMLLNKLA